MHKNGDSFKCRFGVEFHDAMREEFHDVGLDDLEEQKEFHNA